MKKITVYHDYENWLVLEPENIDKHDLGIILNNLPVVEIDNRNDLYKISLYYYDVFIKLMKKHKIKVYHEERVSKLHSHIKTKLNCDNLNDILPTKVPKLWTKDKDKQILPSQYEAIKRVLYRRKYMIADSMGVGKTIEAIGVMCYAFQIGYKKSLLVVMASLKEQWKSEILRFTKIKEDEIYVVGDNQIKCLTGETTHLRLNRKVCKECKRLKECSKYKNNPVAYTRKQIYDDKNRIVIINYEILHKYKEQLKKAGFDIYILDESSKIKNYATRQTKTMLSIAKNFEFDDIVVPMTGTPFENKEKDIYTVFNILDSAIFGKWVNFKNRFLEFDIFGAVTGAKNLDELSRIFNSFAIRRTLKEVWKERPDFILTNRYCELSSVHRRYYSKIINSDFKGIEKDIDKDTIKKINKAQVTAMIVYSIMIASSLETTLKTKKYSSDECSAKLKMLKDIMTTEYDGKAVVFSQYAKKIIPIIKREMGKVGVNCVVVDGSVKKNHRSKIVNKFFTDNNRILLCSDAMGYGVNMQKISTLINFDLPWNPAVLEQRIGRVYRRGQKNPVNIINLISSDTIEEYLFDKLYQKGKMIDQLSGSNFDICNTKTLNVDTILKDILK